MAGPEPRWQPETWFPPPNQNDPAENPGRQLVASLHQVRQILPLPPEQILAPDNQLMAKLAEKVRSAADTPAVIRLAHVLTSRELNLIFPLLATTTWSLSGSTISQAATRDAEALADRLNLIIRERACPTLYAVGWLTLQKYYPSRPLGQALAILCRILEIKQQPLRKDEAPEVRPFAIAQPLISQIVPPNARHFIQRLVRELPDHDLTLNQFLQQYQVQTDSPLGAALTARSFLADEGALFTDGQKLFAQILQNSGLDTQSALLHHFFIRTKLEPQVRNRYCQQIYQIFGDPAAGHPIWAQVKNKDQAAFREWVKSATIGTHCRQNQEKAFLYLEYADHLEKVEYWNKDTLLLYFPKFIIADSRKTPYLAICYERKDDSQPLFELANENFKPNPADPAIPHRQVEDAIRQNTLQGIIGLPFDPEGIKLTGVFFRIFLKSNRPGWLRKLSGMLKLPWG